MVRLLILYLLQEGPRSGYDLRKILASPFLRFWFKIEDPSIYSCLKTLAKESLVSVASAGRSRKYEITRNGEAQLETLVSDYWRETQESRVAAALAISSDLPESDLARNLTARLEMLESRLHAFAAIEKGALSKLLAEREALMLRTEIYWLRRKIKEMEHG